MEFQLHPFDRPLHFVSRSSRMSRARIQRASVNRMNVRMRVLRQRLKLRITTGRRKRKHARPVNRYKKSSVSIIYTPAYNHVKAL